MASKLLPFAIALALSGPCLASGLNGSGGAGTAEPTRACQAAADILSDQKDFTKGDSFDAATLPQMPFAEKKARIFWARSDQWRGQVPPAKLVDRWFATKPESVASCETVVSKLGTPPIFEQTPAPAPPIRYGVSATLPVFDRAGTKAVMLVRRRGNALGGYLKIVYIAKQGATWKRIGERFVSIS